MRARGRYDGRRALRLKESRRKGAQMDGVHTGDGLKMSVRRRATGARRSCSRSLAKYKPCGTAHVSPHAHFGKALESGKEIRHGSASTEGESP